jgi:DNA polymerase I
MEPLYILDGYSLIYKSYFAMIKRPLYNPEGRNTSAMYGFFRSLFSFFKKYDPRYFAVALDSLTPTFRHEKYPEYKATREKTPEELHAQIPVIEEMLDALGIVKIRENGVEADDIMATIAERCRKGRQPCFLLSGDKDLLQLVDGPVKVLFSEKGSYTEVGRQEVYAKFGIYPEQVQDYLSLIGDSADNIPGVKGVGPKTAVDLLTKYGTLDGIYEHLDECAKSRREKLEAGRESAYRSKDLVQLKSDVPVKPSPEDLKLPELDVDAVIPLFLREGMKKLVEELGGEQRLEKAGEQQPEKEYERVTDSKTLAAWVRLVEKAGWFAFDSETTGLNVASADPVGFSLSTAPGRACYIPLKAPDTECLPEEEIKEALRGILTDPKLKCIGQNIKYDYQICRRWGITIENIAFDTMIAAWLVESNASYGMDSMAERYLHYKTITFSETVPKGGTFDMVPIDTAVDYAAEDADITYRLYELLRKKLREEEVEKLFYEIEMPLVVILAEMELEGIGVDSGVLQDYSEEIGGRLRTIEKEIFDLCGEEFNINSTKQLQEILFEKRQLQPVKKIKTGFSTDNYVLEELSKEDPVPALVLKHRGYSKLKSTYVDALPKLVNPETGRLHTSFMQTGTATGRLSSRDPNLQNIPIKTEEGRKIRSAFTPRKGNLFISADYSQIELVVLAHLSGDPGLCSAFQNGIDVHKQTASLIFDVDTDAITPEQRRIAKVINFGIMYGMSGFRLSRELGIPRQRADEFIDSYFKKYAGVLTFINATIREAEKTGRAKTMFGRSRVIPGINSRNRNEKMGAERMAVNTPIQGSAADIVKKAMLGLWKKLPDLYPETRMVLQVHDELIFEAPRNTAEEAAAAIQRIMEDVVELRVPLKAGVETGTSWGELH